MEEINEVKTDENDLSGQMLQVIEPEPKPKLISLYKDVKGKKVKISQLVPFDKHPFNVPSKTDPDMQKLIKSIEKEGLLDLPIVRKIGNETEEDTYQIISGHRRIEAYKILGFEEISVRIIDCPDDDVATIIMISSNVQRETINFTERVKACALMYETKKHQGKSTGKEEEKSTREYVGKIWNFSANKVQRYVELSKLSDTFFDLIEDKKLSSAAATEISSMSKSMQDLMEEIISENEGLRITKKQAHEIRKQKELTTKDKILEFLQNNNEDTQVEETTQSENTGLNISFSIDELKQYFPELENPTEENIKSIIFERLGLNREPNQENY